MNAQDYTDIVQLLARYCHLVDNGDWEALISDVFAPGGSMTVTGIYETTRGAEALIDLYGVRMQHPQAHESTSVVVLESDETTASIVSKWVTVRHDGTCGSGVYADLVTRTDNGWRITARVATPDRS